MPVVVWSTSGVENENFRLASMLRLTFQAWEPSLVFKAMTKGSRAPSQLKMSLLSVKAGVPPLPCTGGYLMVSFSQATLPSRLSAAVPK